MTVPEVTSTPIRAPGPIAGLLLAAGAGRRMGRPKALVELNGRPLVLHALDALRGGGLDLVLVVLGADAGRVRPLLPAGVETVVADGWAEGIGASLRAGLAALADHPGTPSAALVHLVDLPRVGDRAIARVAAASGSDPAGALARGVYRGTPGHPVLIGRDHWPALAATARGDSGARSYLAGSAGLRTVECSDIADPRDVDTPGVLAALRTRPGPAPGPR